MDVQRRSVECSGKLMRGALVNGALYVSHVDLVAGMPFAIPISSHMLRQLKEQGRDDLYYKYSAEIDKDSKGYRSGQLFAKVETIHQYFRVLTRRLGKREGYTDVEVDRLLDELADSIQSAKLRKYDPEEFDSRSHEKFKFNLSRQIALPWDDGYVDQHVARREAEEKRKREAEIERLRDKEELTQKWTNAFRSRDEATRFGERLSPQDASEAKLAAHAIVEAETKSLVAQSGQA